MYSPSFRLLMIALSVGAGIYTLCQGFVGGWLFIVAAVLFAVGYWRYASVWRAWRSFQRGDLAAVERQLATTPDPARLAPQQRAYHAWLRGEVLRHQGDALSAQSQFLAAATGALRSPKDRAFAYSRLAEARFAGGDPLGARAAITDARALQPPPFVEALLLDLEAAMAAG